MASSLHITQQELEDRIYITGEWLLPGKEKSKMSNAIIDEIVVHAQKESHGSLEYKMRNFLNRAKEHGALGKKNSFWKKLSILVFKLTDKKDNYVIVINKRAYTILVNKQGWMYQTK